MSPALAWTAVGGSFSRLKCAFVAGDGDGDGVAFAVGGDGELDEVGRAFFVGVGDEFVGGVVLGVGADVFVELIHGLDAG